MTPQAFRNSAVSGVAETVVCGSLAKNVNVIVVSTVPADGKGPMSMSNRKMELLVTPFAATCADVPESPPEMLQVNHTCMSLGVSKTVAVRPSSTTVTLNCTL